MEAPTQGSEPENQPTNPSCVYNPWPMHLPWPPPGPRDDERPPDKSKIIQYGCRILVILNSGAEIIISNNSTSNCRWHHRTANAAGWLPQQLASQQDASEVQMTIAQTKVWAACLGGLGCLSRAACCVCRAGAGLRLVGSRRVSSRLELILTPQLTQRTN